MSNHKQLVEDIALSVIEELKSYFLVQLSISSSNHILILYDADGTGVNINTLASLNRKIRDKIDLENYYPNGNYSLEISSYGLERPLLLNRQYVKNIGRGVEIILNDSTKKTGKLIQVSDEDIEIEIAIKKQAPKKELVAFKDIKETFIEIIF